jgi:effector-binding domain-containing protein
MQIKEVKPMTFFYYSVQTTLRELLSYVRVVAKDLHKEAALHDIKVTGPVYWQYIGFNGNPVKEFTLEIALPVADIRPTYTGKFQFRKTESFKCLSTWHEGSWAELSQTYGALFDYISQHGLTSIGVNREIYFNMDFNQPEANLTEVQIGIA